MIEAALVANLGTHLGAAFVDRGDDRPHRDAEIDQQHFRQLERTFERFGDSLRRAGAVQPGGVVGIARTRYDRDIAIARAEQPRDALLLDRIVHRQDDCPRRIELEIVEYCGARNVAK